MYLVCRLLLEKKNTEIALMVPLHPLSLLSRVHGVRRDLHSFPTRRSSDLDDAPGAVPTVRSRRVHGEAGRAGERRRDDVGQLRALGSARRGHRHGGRAERDRKSTRLNSSHRCISYAVFCLKKKIPRLRSWCLYILSLCCHESTASDEIYTLSLHDALPISTMRRARFRRSGVAGYTVRRGAPASAAVTTSASFALSDPLGAAIVTVAAPSEIGRAHV